LELDLLSLLAQDDQQCWYRDGCFSLDETAINQEQQHLDKNDFFDRFLRVDHPPPSKPKRRIKVLRSFPNVLLMPTAISNVVVPMVVNLRFILLSVSNTTVLVFPSSVHQFY
jgi:hypothetical protein